MAELTDDVRKALDGKQFWSLATVNPDGTPQSTLATAHQIVQAAALQDE